MPTVLEHITGALRLLGVIADGELPSSEEADSAFVAFNQWLDSMSIHGLVAHSTVDQALIWPTGESLRTIGPSGNIVATRPVSVIPSTYYNDGALDNGLKLIGEDEYRSLALKDLSAPPTHLFMNYTTPNAEAYLYPVPTEQITLHLISTVELAQAADLGDDIIVPPGFLRAFRYGLAIELAPEFGVEPSPNISRIAWQSMRIVKRTNTVNAKKNNPRLPAELSAITTGSIYEG